MSRKRRVTGQEFSTLVHTWCAVVVYVSVAVTGRGEESWQFARLGTEQGLSHNSVYALLVDRDGFVWAGTVDGLNRFDGYEFLTFRHDPRDDRSLSSTVVQSLEELDDSIWIGTGDGLDRLNRRSLVPERVALRGLQIFALEGDSVGRLWIASNRGLYLRERDGRVGRVELASRELAEATFADLAIDPEGTVWAIAHVGEESIEQLLIPIRDGRPADPFSFDQDWPTIRSFAFDREGRLWLHPGKPARLDLEERVVRPPPGASASELDIWDVSEGIDGAIWFSAAGALCRQSGPDASADCAAVEPAGSWLDNYVRSFAQGRDEIIWVGTYSGLRRLDPLRKPFHRWTHVPGDPETLATDAVSSIFAGDHGELWVATFGGGLDRIDRARGSVTHFRHDRDYPRSLPDDTVWTIRGGPEGELWLGTVAGMTRFDPETGTFTTPPQPEPGSIWALAVDPAGDVWGSGPLGLVRWDRESGTVSPYELPVPVSARGLQALAHDGEGTLWIGSGSTAELLELRIATGELVAHQLEVGGTSLRSEGIWSLRFDEQGSLWIGHGRGLSRYDRTTERFDHWFATDGLPGSVAYGIELDQRGDVWVGTNRGLVRFSEQAPDGRQFRVFDDSDGIASMEFNRDAAHEGPDGELLFGGIGGLTTFFPDEIRDDTRSPPVVLTDIEILGSSRRTIVPYGLERLTLSHGDQPVTFEFAALNYTNAGRASYRYLLEGFDEDWIGGDGRRFARYTNLPPGEYRFLVEASNQDGAWNREGIALPVTVRPAFWQSWWFRLAVLAAIAALLFAIHRARIERVVEMERLRLRIAGDLHDDLSSDLSGMSMMAELIRRRLSVRNEELERLDELGKKATELADAVRDTAWGIHPEHDDVGSMVRRMRATAELLLGEIPYDFDVQGVELDRSLSMTKRRNFYLIFKELVHNIVRHAGASNVEIGLEQEGHRLSLTLVDDGRGFDLSEPHDGDGLKNLGRRVDQIGGTFAVDSAPGRGTRVEVTMDLWSGTSRRFGMSLTRRS